LKPITLIAFRWLSAALFLRPPAGTGTTEGGTLIPILRETTAAGAEAYATFDRKAPGTLGAAAFRAFTGRNWLTGLVPVYAFERHGAYQTGPPPAQGTGELP
jgi:hypothetical protein